MTESTADTERSSRPRRQRHINRPRLMDGSLTPQEFGPGTPVAIYIRVSSEEQVEGFSLGAQLRACRDFAERRHWIVVEVYEDPGESGKNDRRPGFQKMIQGAQAGRYKVLLVHKLDRFSRNIDNTLKYFRELNNFDVTVASVTEDFDYSTPMGRMFFRMMAVFAQWYLENLSAETVKGKQERAQKGLHNGRVPFGYQVVEGKREAQVVPQEAAVLKKAFEMYSTGQYTDRQIAAYLNERGFVTRKGRPWSKDTVRDFLQNEFFYGKVVYHDQLIQGRHEPIISQDLYDQCQKIRHQRGKRGKSFNATPKRFYLLHRIILCAKCGRPLRMQKAMNFYYYKEASHERGLPCEHAGKSVRMERADAQVLEILKSIRLPRDWQDILEEGARNADEVTRQEMRRNQLQDQLRRLSRRYQDGLVTDDEYERTRDQIRAEIDRLMPADITQSVALGLRLEALAGFLDEATEAERSEIAHLMLETLHYDLAREKIVRLRPRSDFMVLFQMIGRELGWREEADGSFRL